MNSKKTSNENFSSFDVKKILLILGSIAIGIFLFVFSILASIQNSQIYSSPQNTSQSYPEEVLQLSEQPQRVLISNSNGEHSFEVAVATTEETRQKGLMGVRSMDQDQGMLFVFPSNRSLSFWMKNTFIPLDMIFIDEDYTIINIHENAKPLDTTPRYSSESPAKYVLELNAGVSSSKNIKAGDRVELIPTVE